MNFWNSLDKLKKQKRFCPACCEAFYPGACAIVATVTDGKAELEGQEPVLKPAPSDRRGLLAAILHPEPLNGPEYTLRAARRKCPLCGYLLPDNIERTPNLSIAIVGDTSAGKSHYLAALIHQMQGNFADRGQSIRFTCLTKKLEKEYTDEYFRPLLEQNQAIKPTQAKKVMPLIYELTVGATAEHLERTVNLILYDAAGEVQQGDRMLSDGRYIFNASAIILMVDPLAIPTMAEELKKYRQYDTVRNDVTSYFNEVLRQYRNFHRLAPTMRKLPIPIAVTLSKSDLLKHLRGRHSSDKFYFSSNPVYRGSIDLQDVNCVDQEVRGLLDKYDVSLLQATEFLTPLQYFAVSATGYPPDENGIYPRVEVTRCLDPILWVLKQLKVIKDSSYIR